MKKELCFVAFSLILAGCGEESKTVSYETNAVTGDSCSSLQESSSSLEPLSSSEAVVSSSSKAEEIVYGTLYDSRNDKTYKTVVIGEGESAQEWMAENLNIKEVNKYGFCYDNQPYYCELYGMLYPWETAQKMCPEGWRLPSKEDFEKLSENMGNSFTEGTRLRSKEGWPHKDGTDNFGFNALPAGYKLASNDFRNMGEGAYFWTSSQTEDGQPLSFSLIDMFDAESVSINDRRYALSIRCLKDK